MTGLPRADGEFRWFDTHAHLQDARIPDPTALIARARAAGIRRVLCCGTGESDWPRVRALAEAWPGFVLPAYGLHPWRVGGRTPDWHEALRAALDADPSAAVGEIGLDHGVAPSDDAAQEDIFRFQLRAARELGRPASIHGRRAWARIAGILESEGPFPAGIALHAFSGPPDLVPRLAAAGACFSFAGALTWERNRRARRALAAVPPDRLLLESDTPDLAAAGQPAAPDGGRPLSEPAHLPLVARAAAEALGWTVPVVAHRAWENAVRVFGPDG